MRAPHLTVVLLLASTGCSFAPTGAAPGLDASHGGRDAPPGAADAATDAPPDAAPDAAAVAQSCAGSPDGTRTLYVAGDPARPWGARCVGGLTYLPVTEASNFGQYTVGGFATGTTVKTTYPLLRVDPATLAVDIDDQSQAHSSGALAHPNGPNPVAVTSMPLGVAMDCAGPNSTTGAASIDLTGTPFHVTSTFALGGNKDAGTATTGGQVITVRGGGKCGWNAPAGANGNPFNAAAGVTVQLAYGP